MTGRTAHLYEMAFAHWPRRSVICAALALAAAVGSFVFAPALAGDAPSSWLREWPDTDFSRATVDFGEIQSGGPPKDGIPAIDRPQFKPIAQITDIADTEPTIVVTVGGETKVYPLRILTWHEIVNDTIGGVPVTVTYCPLCNAAIVFDARLGGKALTFGTTGKLRRSDLVMYDRQTESWWQQFSGEAIIGALTGEALAILPSRMESFARAKVRAPAALVLVPDNASRRAYGQNPYVGYDTAVRPFLYAGELPADVAPMMRVVVVEGEAWALPLIREKGRIERGDLVLEWSAGQNSALDARLISQGRDVGNVTVKRKTDSGLIDAVHHVTFAFVYHAFHPEGAIFQD